MKRILFGLFSAAIMFSAPVFADLEVPGEDNPVLSSDTISLKDVSYNVVKRIDKNTVTIKVSTSAGTQFWVSDALGEQEKMFTLDGKATGLAIKDLTGDGTPELITAAMIGPDSSALYVFKLDAEAKKFVPMNFKYEKSDLARDFMVSDMYQENGQDIEFMPENTVRALGKIYAENAENPPAPGFYYFKLASDSFVCSKIEPVPTDAPDEKAPEVTAPDEKTSEEKTPDAKVPEKN